MTSTKLCLLLVAGGIAIVGPPRRIQLVAHEGHPLTIGSAR